jgi:stage II sporulation protein D
MTIRASVIYLLFFLSTIPSNGQVRIRIFSDSEVGSVVFNALEGSYELDIYNGNKINIAQNKPVIITHFKGKIAVKSSHDAGFLCDSLILKGVTGNDLFSLRVMGDNSLKRSFCGDLQCLNDLGTLFLINVCNIEDYVAGVVMSEGGTGQDEEYFKTQAVIARTYTYKYFKKHTIDRYNLCDNTHCQAYLGYCSDKLINQATLHTKDLVILSRDSSLVTAAFHSNCGGETTSSENVWVSGQSYLKKVVDPYCTRSRNASWTKSYGIDEWVSYLRKSGYTGSIANPLIFMFPQETRVTDYRIGSFSKPFRTIRTDLGLRSSFFSVVIGGDSVVLKGRGYGHGVGLCQEGAMVMALKGYDFRQIINFYYTGVIITDIKNAVFGENE